MTDPMQAAIEVAANALDEELKFEQIGVRDLAEAAYAAIEPLVRNAVADAVAEMCEDVMGVPDEYRAEFLVPGLKLAVRIAREIGGGV